MIVRNALPTEIRASYKAAGHTVRISRDGHVTFRRDGTGPWLEGHHVSEYRFHDDLGVVLA